MKASLWTRFRHWQCRAFDHTFSDNELLMFKIELSAVNRDRLHPTIACRRCGEIFEAKDAARMEQKLEAYLETR
jgi:formylmethanofuran dehydrogenase subunit E